MAYVRYIHCDSDNIEAVTKNSPSGIIKRKLINRIKYNYEK